jgi:hypothetical protein
VPDDWAGAWAVPCEAPGWPAWLPAPPQAATSALRPVAAAPPAMIRSIRRRESRWFVRFAFIVYFLL